MRPTLTLVIACALPMAVLATTMPVLSLSQRAQRADKIVIAQVVSSNTVVERDDPRTMRTLTTVVVGEIIKGTPLPKDTLTVQQIGGRFGLWESHLPGDAVFVRGETAVLLLHCGDGDLCALDALGEGHIKLSGSNALLYQVASGKTETKPAAQVLTEIRKAIARPR